MKNCSFHSLDGCRMFQSASVENKNDLLELGCGEKPRPTNIFKSVEARERMSYSFDEDEFNKHAASVKIEKFTKEIAFQKKVSCLEFKMNIENQCSLLCALEKEAISNVEHLSSLKRMVKMNIRMEESHRLKNATIIKKFLKAIKRAKRVHMNFYSKSRHLGTPCYNGCHQDNKLQGGACLLFKILSAIEFAILSHWNLECENAVKSSEECCLHCAICFDDANCLNYSIYSHNAVAGDTPSSTIVADLHEDQNPCKVAEIGLKVLSEAAVEGATIWRKQRVYSRKCAISAKIKYDSNLKFS